MEFYGKDLEEAIRNAAEALSLPAEELRFTIVSMGSRGFLGLGRKKARIAVIPGEPEAAAGSAGAEAAWAETDKKGRPGEGLDFMRETAPAAPRPGPPREKPGRRSKDKERKEGHPQENEALPPLDFSCLPPPPTEAAPGETVFAGEPDEAMRAARDILLGILDKMGFPLEAEVKRIAGRIILKVADSPDNALIIGGRGATLEALEFLVGRIWARRFKQAEPSAAPEKIFVDVADYRARRQAALLESLSALAREVRRHKKPQTMTGLNSAERRLVQLALRPARDLASRNDAPRDCVVISPQRHKEKSR